MFDEIFNNLKNNLKDFVSSKIEEAGKELEKRFGVPEAVEPFTLIRQFTPTDSRVTQGGIAISGETWQIEAYNDGYNQPFINSTEPLRNVILFEVAPPDVQECVLACRFYAKASNTEKSIRVSIGRPYEHNGLILSFWEFVEVLQQPPDPVAVGRALRSCHEVLSNFQGDLTVLEPFEESPQILAQLISEKVFSASDAEMLVRICQRVNNQIKQIQAPMQPLHGDANFSNVLNTTRGVLWGDWEDTFIGPVAWDLACLIARARVFGTEIEQVNAALKGYGIDIDAVLLDLLVEARTFQTVLWNYIIGQHDPQSLERLNARLQWFRERQS